MQKKSNTLKERLNEVLKWDTIKFFLVVSTLVAILLTYAEFIPDIKFLLRSFVRHFVFAQCIGNSIYLLGLGLDIGRIKNKWTSIPALFGVFVIGGWIGALIGLGINALLVDFYLSIQGLKSFFVGITFFNILVAFIVNIYFVLWEKLQKTAAKLAEKEINEQNLLRIKAKAELDALRAKINPHFLFNTLNSIASLIPVDPEKAEEMVQKLSHLFHYALNPGKQEMIKLSEDLDLIRGYLEIEKIRLETRLSYYIEVDEKLKEVLIPGMLLQPLVENSIKHGIAPTKKGGRIEIKCRNVNGYCEVEILDSGKGFDLITTEAGFGLSGVQERLALHYGNQYDFQITAENGVRIFIQIPVKNKV